MKKRLLVVEDDAHIRLGLCEALRAEGYDVIDCRDGAQAGPLVKQQKPDLVILDIMLPRCNGLDVCRGIRLAGLATPILLLTARGQTVDKVVGLKLGADDYVTKPFDTIELMARIEVLLRRYASRSGPGLYKFGTISVDFRGTQVTRDGAPVCLTAREFQLLRYLIERAGATLSRAEILREVWGYEGGTFSRTVDVHVASLRQKLEDMPKKPKWIVTVPGLGYRFQG